MCSSYDSSQLQSPFLVNTWIQLNRRYTVFRRECTDFLQFKPYKHFVDVLYNKHSYKINKLCRRLPQYAPAPCKFTLKVVSVTCDVGYLCANFSLPRPLCSRLRPDVRDRQTSNVVRRTSTLKPPRLGA